MNQIEKINFSISADYILNIGTKLKNQEQEIENLKNINEILINHIKTLDNRSKKFSDKFRFGRFKFKSISEKLNSEKLSQQQKKITFNLNDE